jgi:hypothetical protein
MPFTTVVQIAFPRKLGLEPHAAVSQISSPRTGPASTGAISQSEDAIGNKLPAPSPQEVAVQRPRIPQVAALIARLSRPNDSLITAVEKCNMSKVCEILNDQRKAVWLDRKSFYKAITWAAGSGEEQVVRLLIDKGADVNYDARDAFDGSALECASKNGHEQVVRMLLDQGANVNAHSGSALRVASANGHERVVWLLLKKGADVHALDVYARSALYFAQIHRHEQVAQLLRAHL